jgi:antitoxin ParD1/3/4
MASFAKFWYCPEMTTMNVSLPDELKSYVDEQVGDGGFGSTSEYVRDLIRRDRDRQQLRRALLDGASSSPGPIADASYFTTLRDRIRSDV